jgi:ATP adenylyltransferase
VDRLWAGWRMAYIKRATSKRGKREPCLFCSKGRVRPSARSLILAAGPRAVVMLNLYPYNVGHVMVAPRRHVRSFGDLTGEEAVELNAWLARVESALRRVYRPHGYNVGLNLGRAAGAGVLGHLHWHVVPRWKGDTNYMPVTGGTKVLPESLDRTYRRLREALESARAAPRRRGR